MRQFATLALTAIVLFAGPLHAQVLEQPPRLERTVTERPFELTVDRRQCGTQGVYVQVLGAGGPALDDGQASSGYLVWIDGKARILVDAGPGVALRFEESGADFRDLHAIVFTQTHTQHAADLPALIMGSTHIGRNEDLPVFGPAGSDSVTGFNDWISMVLGPTGPNRQLADFLTDLSDGGYKVVAAELNTSRRTPWSGFHHENIRLSAIGTDHGNRPALAWRVDVDGVGITFTGSTANRRQLVNELAEGSVMLVTHHAIPEQARGLSREMFMTPSQIGRLAADVSPNRLILSHRTPRTRGRETQSRDLIREHYRGSVVFANDLNCWRI